MPLPSKPPNSPKPRAALTARRRAFVREFCICRNGAEAARKAGYSKDAAKEIAYRLLHRPEIQDAIRRREEGDERLVGSRRYSVLNRLNEVADRAMQAKSVRAGKKPGVYRFDGPTAVRALELLGKHEGLFRDGLDVRVQGKVEELLEGVRPLMSPVAYDELVRALAEIAGVSGVATSPAEGDRSDAVH